ncbi:hypothetical protein ZWY2020_024686 [Hordeum vulgare]|nr:hypothetical protein ZWY2020_024686 [Hordeum vulgare]
MTCGSCARGGPVAQRRKTATEKLHQNQNPRPGRTRSSKRRGGRRRRRPKRNARDDGDGDGGTLEGPSSACQRSPARRPGPNRDRAPPWISSAPAIPRYGPKTSRGAGFSPFSNARFDRDAAAVSAGLGRRRFRASRIYILFPPSLCWRLRGSGCDHRESFFRFAVP